MSYSSAKKMTQLRRDRRAKGRCAECGQPSNGGYLCFYHEEKRKQRKNGNHSSPFFRSEWKIKNRRFANVMKDRGIKISDLSIAIGVSDRTVHRWLYENGTPNIKHAIKAAEFLGCELGDVFPEFEEG
ncbi:DNA-binding XRE family transcriptional regulator [Paenibacillus sp. LBL]|uniref:helix-turn-helix domain-containing protein n=1 Tax=Paenibacillus sp. LBL TaxID=2940563 RepID=UPI002475E428|nr:helix-turn-helix transcriptional regulator [Paenibacillus sp. LBL]MDH6674333.1 DNA-binding XRE family transcriptional regulator [Paenibacillus sp. LBL]